jgi:LysM repeat protein
MKLKNLFLSLLALMLVFSMAAMPASASAAASQTCTQFHTVQRGEYLVKIADQYDTNWRYLAELNNLANPSRIFTGQRLCVAATPATQQCTLFHTVQRGEYLSLIAAKYNTTWPRLAEINDLANPSRIFAGQKLCVQMGTGTGGGDTPTTPPGYSGFPTFSIVSVVEDTSVQIRTNNLPPNDVFTVKMGRMGTKGVGGVTVGTLNSGSGGTLTAEFNIPEEMRDRRQVAIRIESPTSGFFAYNWFWNATASGTGGGDEPTTPPPSSGTIPTFSITKVVADGTVTIQTKNFPANVQFDVLMGKIGTRGVNGTKVTTISSGTGGSLTLTFDIPAALHDQAQIAIRLQAQSGGWFAYNWFWNNNAP